MQLYEVSPSVGAKSTWHGSRGEAHDAAKLIIPREDCRLYLWAMPTDKDAILSMLNGITPKAEPLAAWSLTARGGLHEVPLARAKAELAEQGTAAAIALEDELNSL